MQHRKDIERRVRRKLAQIEAYKNSGFKALALVRVFKVLPTGKISLLLDKFCDHIDKQIRERIIKAFKELGLRRFLILTSPQRLNWTIVPKSWGKNFLDENEPCVEEVNNNSKYGAHSIKSLDMLMDECCVQSYHSIFWLNNDAIIRRFHRNKGPTIFPC